MNSIAFSYHLLLPMGGRLAGNIPSLRGEPFSKGGNSDSTLSVQGYKTWTNNIMNSGKIL